VLLGVLALRLGGSWLSSRLLMIVRYELPLTDSLRVPGLINYAA